MRWLLLLIAVFGVCDGLAIVYWRQTGNDPSGTTMLGTLVLLPIAIVGSIYGVSRLAKWYANRQTQPASTTSDSQAQPLDADNPLMPWLHIYHVALQTAFGDQSTKTLIEQLQAFVPPSTDTELSRKTGSALTRRIADLPIQTIETQSLSAEAARAQAILQQLLITYDPILTLAAEKMKYGELMANPAPLKQQQAILHPAWTGQDFKAESKVNEIEPVKSSWSQLSLQILVLFPAQLSEDDQQSMMNEIRHTLDDYQFIQDRFSITAQRVASADECALQINQHCTALADHQNPKMLMLLGADSTLTQSWLNRTHQSFIPAEAGFSVLMSNECVVIPELATIARVTPPIWATRQKPIYELGKVHADELSKIVNELSHRYQLPIGQCVPEAGVLMSDLSAEAPLAHREELLPVMDTLALTAQQVVYAGLALEQTTTLASGLTLTLAIQQTQQSEMQTPVLSSSGDTVRTIWLVAPLPKPVAEETEAEL